MTLISATEEPKQKAPKEAKAPLWAPAPQHNFMKNWQRNLALWKRQQEALSGKQRGRAPTWPRLAPGPAAARSVPPPVQRWLQAIHSLPVFLT